MEGSIEVTGRRGRRSKQPLDDLKGNGKMEGSIEVTGRRGRRSKQPLDDLKGKKLDNVN